MMKRPARVLIIALVMAALTGCRSLRYPYILVDTPLLTKQAEAELFKELAAACPDVELEKFKLPLGLGFLWARDYPQPYWFLSVYPSDDRGFYVGERGTFWGFNFYRVGGDNEGYDANAHPVLEGRSVMGADKTLADAASRLCAAAKNPRWLSTRTSSRASALQPDNPIARYVGTWQGVVFDRTRDTVAVTWRWVQALDSSGTITFGADSTPGPTRIVFASTDSLVLHLFTTTRFPAGDQRLGALKRYVVQLHGDSIVGTAYTLFSDGPRGPQPIAGVRR